MRAVLILILALTAAAGLALGPAAAQTGGLSGGANSLREALFGDRFDTRRAAPAPPVARYVAEAGDSFVFDRTAAVPLLKFEDSQEVLALYPQPAARGDMIYNDDLGRPVLRSTRLGGLTLFTDEHPGGAAAALDGQAETLRPGPLSPQALLQRLAQASARTSRAARRLIPFEAPDVVEGAEPVYADAAQVTADAVVRLTRTPEAKGQLMRFSRVRFTQGHPPSASIQGGALNIVVSPARGVAGRPSSQKVLAAFAE